MSFDLSPIKQPLIQSSQRMQNDGGGGNLGYMNQGRKKKNEKEDEKNSLLNQDDADVIQLSVEDDLSFEIETDINFSPKKWFGEVVDKISDKIVKKPSNPFKNF